MSTNTAFSQSVSNKDLTNALEELSQNNFAKRVHIAPALPEKQLKNAISSMRVPGGSNILVLVDDSLTKSGKGGICVTSDGIYWKKLLTKGSIKFDDIKQFSANLGFLMAFKINGREIPLDHFSKEEIQPVVDFLIDIRNIQRKRITAAKRRQIITTKKGVESKPQRIRKTLKPTVVEEISELRYFEVSRPEGDGLCSDDDCPCGPATRIPRGTGYLYISPDVVDFRRDARSIKDAAKKLQRLQKQLGGGLIIAASGVFTPVLVCKRGARLRRLDLEVAAADAGYWWETGKVPLRPTPLAGKQSKSEKKTAVKPKADADILALIERLKSDNSNIQSEALEQLNDLAKKGEKRLLPYLIEVLHQGNDVARGFSAVALGVLGDKQAVKPLIEALNDKSWSVCYEAIEALGHIRDLRAIEPIKKRVISTDKERVRGRGVIVLDEVFNLSKAELKEVFLKSKASEEAKRQLLED